MAWPLPAAFIILGMHGSTHARQTTCTFILYNVITPLPMPSRALLTARHGHATRGLTAARLMAWRQKKTARRAAACRVPRHKLVNGWRKAALHGEKSGCLRCAKRHFRRAKVPLWHVMASTVPHERAVVRRTEATTLHTRRSVAAHSDTKKSAFHWVEDTFMSCVMQFLKRLRGITSPLSCRQRYRDPYRER